MDVEIPITMPPSLNVPAGAVLDLGTKAIVYVNKGDGVFEPRRVKTGWNLGGQVGITGGLQPGEKIAVSGNFLIDSESRMDLAASGTKVEMREDPVLSGPVREKQTDRKKRERVILPKTERSWADMLDPARGRRNARDGGKEAIQEPKDRPGKSPTSGEVVDWAGPDKEGAPARDWSGWGKFPGSDYLGIKRETKNKSSPPANLSEAEGEKGAGKEQGVPKAAPTPGARGSKIKPGIQDRPAPDQPRPPAE